MWHEKGDGNIGMNCRALPIPDHFAPEKVGEIWRVSYAEMSRAAGIWSRRHGIRPASEDKYRIALLLVDIQNTFCIPEFELYVGGRTGTGAVDDNRRLCKFIYRNLGMITQIIPTLDTHRAMQVFHSLFWINDLGEHPQPYSQITVEDVMNGRWKADPEALHNLGIPLDYGQRYLQHYAKALRQSGKYDLTVWPYHAMLGGIGHALVSSVEEAIFFHSIARHSQPEFHIKGSNPLTEHYSVLGPEVNKGPDGETVAEVDDALAEELLRFDATIIAGQAKSHCVAWTIEDLLAGPLKRESALASKIYLLEDCTSPVVIPDGRDFTDAADNAFRRFAEAGMHVVRSVNTLCEWPDIHLG
jgi:nicotinamidase-related amidase